MTDPLALWRRPRSGCIHPVRMMIPSEQCDIAIVETPIDDLAGQSEILRFECVMVMPEQHPLAEYHTLTPQLVAREPIVSLYREHQTTQQLERAFFEARIPWDPVIQSRLFATSCEIVATGGGLAIVDPMTAQGYLSQGLVARRFKPQVVLEIAITLPGEGPYSRLAQDFVARMKAELHPFSL
ncbi:MAG: LysR substrate-binding domain-containing protein [Hyphomicrobiaceae bacterium]|nr:LysR substrate-binding domain-containing protein [Hyphomicrobiaceae bacterium]